MPGVKSGMMSLPQPQVFQRASDRIFGPRGCVRACCPALRFAKTWNKFLRLGAPLSISDAPCLLGKGRPPAQGGRYRPMAPPGPHQIPHQGRTRQDALDIEVHRGA